jgi:hypothetical protein
LEWQRWTYLDWNQKLAEYYFAASPNNLDIPVDRIAPTPEELAKIIGVDPTGGAGAVEAFVSRVRRELRPGQGFCDYCSGYHWDPDDLPPFFAMLWFTCLVAYGYPDGAGAFNERLARALGKAENFHTPGADSPCLPGLWEGVADWTRARHAVGARIRELNLPVDVGRRTVIGYSHFLTFPNRFDRAKLAALLHEADLVGAEPPLGLLLDTLLKHRRNFSKEFQEDLEDFAREYHTTGHDPRDSAFWRAIRQEAVAPSVAAEGDAPSHASILFVFDDDGLFPIVACDSNFEAPDGYTVEPFDDGLSGLRLVGPEDDRELPSREAMKTGKFLGARDRRFLKSGVLPLCENNAGLFAPRSGEDVHGCRSALVKVAIVSDFTRRFGGTDRPSIVPGWREVHGSDIVQLKELPTWLSGATWLLPTTELPSIYPVGGIPVSDGFLFAPPFLPRLRAPGVVALEVQLPDHSRVSCARKADSDEWELPLAVAAPGDYSIVATWPVDTDQGAVPRTRMTPLRLRAHTITNEYKGLPSGEFFQESCPRHESDLQAPDEPQLTVITADSTQSTDIVDFEASVRFLGPGVGEMTLTPRPGFDWLVVGPKKDPELVMFVGDQNNPTQPREARSPSTGDRRHWHKAWQVAESVRYCRLGTADCTPWADAPTNLRETWLRYRRHSVPDTAEPCDVTSLDTLNFSPPPRAIPDKRVDTVVDAIAALSAERRGLGYRLLSDLFAQLLGHEDLGLIRQLIRAWTEGGLIDEVRHAVSGRAMFVARRPRFVLVRRGPAVDATLVGLLTPATRRRFVDSAAGLGMSIRELGCGNPWQPTVFRARGEPRQVEQLRNAVSFSSPVWLEWPDRNRVPAGLDARAALGTLFTTIPPGSFLPDARWEWSEANFKRGELETAEGIQLSRRMDSNQQRIYVVSSDGIAVCWTFQREWALLAAYDRRGTPPFEADGAGGYLKSFGRAPVHLPLPIARLCVLVGEGLPGPSPVDSTRSEYVYPFGRRLFGLIRQVVPPSWIGH